MPLCDTPLSASDIDVIVFDFDNVIVRGSETCKENAWNEVFEENSSEMKLLKEAQELFKDGKGDRYDILGYIYYVQEGTDARLDEKVMLASKKYDAAVQACILGLGLHGTDLHALWSLSHTYPLYIISATPQEALHTTLQRLGEFYTVDLISLFKLALGTPKNKVENFGVVQSHSGIPAEKMLMVGDGENDYSAARTFGTQFVGVTTQQNSERWRDRTFSKINSISELPSLLDVS